MQQHRRKTQHSLQGTALFEAIPDLVLVLTEPSLTIASMNRAEALGFGGDEIRGKRLGDVIPGATPALIEDLLQGRHDPHPEAPLRVVARHKKGREVPVDLRASRVAGAVVASVREVPERARIAERELVTIVCAAPEAIVTWSLDGSIVSVNPAAERLYGIVAAQAIGMPIMALVPSFALQDFERAVQRVLAGDSPGVAEVVRLRGEQEIDVEESLFLIRDVARHPIRIGSFARDASELARLRRVAAILSSGGTFEPGAGERSEAARAMVASADVAARDARATVLLLGETGVGKSWLARRIHKQSPRGTRPFLAVNCASFDPQLVESELFGHERGAFTGAATQKRGLVEVADGGTLLLDEVGDLPVGAQAKLLAFLDDGTYRRVGGTANLRADVRIIAATNAELEERVARGAFRRDLYYRLRVIPIVVPPLRDRVQDIPALAQEIGRELVGKREGGGFRIQRDALAALKRHTWPGNLRELRNALERALLLSRDGRIELEHLPREIRQREVTTPDDFSLEAAERRHVARVLELAKGNRSRAAAMLGIDRSTLRRKLGDVT